MTLSRAIATLCYVGHLRPAPGTWGSLAALPVAWSLATLAGFHIFVTLTVFLFFAGIWATQKETQGASDHDPSEIVIDELVGQWIALLPVIYGATSRDLSLLALWPGWVAAFVLFRFFDITKLGPIGWADRRKDAVGVMLDDVIAGVFAAVGVICFAVLAHVVMGI